ncbi:MAG: hypothetical protein OHK0057_24020 [Thermoflexibacter sp.]
MFFIINYKNPCFHGLLVTKIVLLAYNYERVRTNQLLKVKVKLNLEKIAKKGD